MKTRPWMVVRALVVTLLFLLWPVRARAQAVEATELAPRDIGIVVQPSTATLGGMPADFQEIDHGWIVIDFPASVRSRIESVLREADDVRAQLSADLGQPVLGHALVRVARTPEQMSELAPRGAPPPAYAAGVAYPSLRLIVVTLQAPDTWEAPDLSEVLGHELSHLALSDAISGQEVPRWFDEGVAIHESGELYLKRWAELWNASLARRLIPLPELDRAFPIDQAQVSVAYAESADVVRFLMREADRARFGSLIQRVRAGVAFDRALGDAYGTDVRTLEYQWREDVGRRFGLVPALTGGGLLWVLIAALSVAAWAKRRQYAKAKLALWAREEAEAEAAVSVADRGAANVGTTEASREEPVVPRVPAVPVVEHEGRWYTLH
jgi:hypothetical protein